MEPEKKKNKKRFEKTKNFFKKLPISLAQRPIIGCVFLFIVAVSLGLIFFYNIYFPTFKKESETLQKPFVIRENVYLNILSIWQEQDKRSAEVDLKYYIDPFIGAQEEAPMLTP